MRSTVAAKALLQAKFQRKKVLRREGGISAKTLEWADAHRAASSFRAALSCDGPLCRQPSCPCVSARYLFVDHRTSTAWGAMESPFTVDAALAWVAAALYYIATGKPPADKQTLQLIDSLCGDELMASPKHETAVLRVEDACCAEQLTHSGEGDDSTGPAPGRQSQTVIAESLDRLVNQELATDGDFLTASVPEEAFPAYPGSNTFQVENRLAMGPVVARILSNARLWEDQRNPRQKTLCRLRSFSARLLRALRKEHATAMHADVVSNGLHRFRVARSDAVRQSLHLDAAGKATLSPVLQTLLLPAPVGWDWGQSSVDQTAFLVGVSILALVLQPTLEQSLRDAMEQLQTAGAPGSADDGGQGVDNAATTWLCDIRWQTLRSLKDLSHDIATLANTPETSTSVDANCAMAAAACTNINSCEIVVHSPKQLKRCFEKLTSTSASGVPLPGSTAFGGIVASMHNGFAEQVSLVLSSEGPDSVGRACLSNGSESGNSPCDATTDEATVNQVDIPGLRFILEGCAAGTPWKTLLEQQHDSVNAWCAQLAPRFRAVLPRAWSWLQAIAGFEARLFFEANLSLRADVNFVHDTSLLRSILAPNRSPAQLCDVLRKELGSSQPSNQEQW